MGKKSDTNINPVSTTEYGNTTTLNPYVTSQTTNKGTTSNFNKGTTFDTINNFVNNNMSNLLDQYLNPSLDSITNKSKINSFLQNLNVQSQKNFENNIVNPLSKRNMIRSSQATDLYNNLTTNNNNQVANFLNQLLTTSQNDTANMLNNLLQWYTKGYSVLAENQAQSLSTSQGNATQTGIKQSKSDSIDYSQIFSDLVELFSSNRG